MMFCKEYGHFLILDPLVKIVGNSELFLIELCTTLFAKFKVKLNNCITTFAKHPSLAHSVRPHHREQQMGKMVSFDETDSDCKEKKVSKREFWF